MTWDAKTSFAWGLGNDLQPETGLTEALKLNPFIDAYGYWYADLWAETEDTFYF